MNCRGRKSPEKRQNEVEPRWAAHILKSRVALVSGDGTYFRLQRLEFEQKPKAFKRLVDRLTTKTSNYESLHHPLTSPKDPSSGFHPAPSPATRSHNRPFYHHAPQETQCYGH